MRLPRVRMRLFTHALWTAGLVFVTNSIAAAHKRTTETPARSKPNEPTCTTTRCHRARSHAWVPCAITSGK